MKRGREAIIELWSLGHTCGVRVDGTSSPCDCPTACGGRWYAVPKVERVLKVLKFDAPSARGGGGGFAADFKECVSLLPVTCPPPFRGWVASAARRKGRLRHGPLCGPGSEDSGRHRAPPRAARVQPTERAGSEGSFICRLRRQENHTTALTGEEMQSPFGGWRHHLSPASGGTITRAYCRAIYEESVSRCFILPPEQGEVRRSRIGGGERSEPISRIVFHTI